ncbi:phosphomannomutase [Spirochaeta africana]|uniref:Phosphomannomutase n=1 Tax=Spirochaeta africana (strain ATCC 700263 / DSM 8902 / Z-7692) TaxID=889378 RepID=H9UJU4_SPIAZ|nr:phosphomannomutase [Spirochaeta africana]AFG37787.1 phosphomannomutase [Spirochaeta africana DSM 8902]
MKQDATGYVDPRTTLFLGSSTCELPLPAPDDLQKLLNTAIISSSGWRFVAAESPEDQTELLTGDAATLAWLMASAAADYFAEASLSTILVACDSRPTGPQIATIAIRALLARGLQVRYSFICPSPEVMAFAAREPELDGFVYISASHNPPGWNGFKLGGSGGGVFDGRTAADLATRLRGIAADMDTLQELHQQWEIVSPRETAAVLESAGIWKEAALQAYRDWTDLIAFTRDSELVSGLCSRIKTEPLGIVQDLNGSARCDSIDTELLGSLGCSVHQLNPGLRNFTHAIVPEGDSLMPCCRELERLHQQDEQYALGYVPDNDGDRGNLVIYDRRINAARPVAAQEVFALSTVAELSWLIYSNQLNMGSEGRLRERAAVVVNGATSLRVEAICRLFDVEVYRAEVGEANVVELAETLRSKGYVVRILGEGSNGGTIVHPARIRDPLNTLLALIKFLRLPPNSAGHTPWSIWADRCGSSAAAADLPGVLDSLPGFQTTGAYEDRALLHGATTDHGALKQAYERLFVQYWEKERQRLHKRYGFFSYRVFNTEGAQQRAGMGSEYRTGDQSGGLTVLFKDDSGIARGFFWMRGSKTEPVFRLMVDIATANPADEQELFQDHRALVEQANRDVLAATAERD